MRPSLANQRVPLVAVQLASGRNRLKEAFASDLNFRVLPSYGNDTQALERLFQQWSGAAPRYQLQRNNIAGPRPLVESQVSTETSFHLARLWAYESVIELLNDGAENSYERAQQLGTDYQLVTPATSAIVLETEAQYVEAGLHAVDGATVPTVPEPETWLLMIGVLICLTSLYRQSRRSGSAQC